MTEPTPRLPSEARPSETRPVEASGTGAVLSARGVRVAFGEHVVLRDLDLDVAPGAVTSVIGPNGCGKTTLLRVLARLLRPDAGKVSLRGEDIGALSGRDLALRMAVLPQSTVSPPEVTVADLVAYGRTPHQTWSRRWSEEDDVAVREAMRMTGVDGLADRVVDTLSGGQRQRVWIAMVLAQGTDLLLLDEPTTYLDLVHALDVMELVRSLRDEYGKTVVMVLHDLTLAARYSDRVVVMRDGDVLAGGAPSEVFTAALVERAFDLEAEIHVDPRGGGPLVVPLGRVRR